MVVELKPNAKQSAQAKPLRIGRPPAWLFTRLAFQNLLRRPTRTLFLVLAVAFGTAAVFASFVVGRGIESSLERGFARMGADLIVVPKETMVNITSALLTVQPTDALLPSELIGQVAKLDGVEQVAPQTIYKVPIMAGMPGCKANLIAFDPDRDFTIIPWLGEQQPRPMQVGDVISGGRRDEALGEEIQPCYKPANIWAKLERSGVGPLDESFFATYETANKLSADATKSSAEHSVTGEDNATGGAKSQGVSAILVKLKFGTTPEQVKFAIAQLTDAKVITGARIVTATRQTTTALVAGMMAFGALMIVGSLIMVSLLFSAIISERKREIGLLRAIGCKRGHISRMLVSEAAFATGLGGICGIMLGAGLLLGFQHSLVYYLETLHIKYSWPATSQMVIAAVGCASAAAAVGLLGAFLPAWKASGQEPSRLIQGEGG